jgi:hypothetical protein
MLHFLWRHSQKREKNRKKESNYEEEKKIVKEL